MSLLDEINYVESVIKKSAADRKLSQEEFLKNYKDFPEIINCQKKYGDSGFVNKAVSYMAKNDKESFCNIVEIRDCESSKGKCTCIKEMIFGEDEINGKICEKFTIFGTSSKCVPNKVIAQIDCISSSAAGPCDGVLFDSHNVMLENEMLRDKLTEIYKSLNEPIDF